MLLANRRKGTGIPKTLGLLKKRLAEIEHAKQDTTDLPNP